MKTLKKTLSKSGQARRIRRSSLNIQIAILAWLVEFFGWFTIFLGSFILGHDNNIVTLTLQTLSLLFYYVLTPSTLLLNSANLKATVTDSDWYIKFHKIFHRQSTSDVKDEGQNEEQNDQAEPENDDDSNNNPTQNGDVSRTLDESNR